jgi:hypothetical protein
VVLLVVVVIVIVIEPGRDLVFGSLLHSSPGRHSMLLLVLGGSCSHGHMGWPVALGGDAHGHDGVLVSAHVLPMVFHLDPYPLPGAQRPGWTVC